MRIKKSIVYLLHQTNKNTEIMTSIINITNQEELDLQVKDCKELQEEIKKLQEKLNNAIELYNKKAYSISICTDEYKDLLQIIK